MQAWLLPSLSGLSALRLAEVPDPTPQPGQVILSVAYAGLNPADRYLSEGQYPARPAFPHILGRDGLGNIIALGEGVRGHALGDKRLILRTDVGVSIWGTFAQKVAVAAESLVPVPAGWTDQQAAGAPLVYITAYQALTQWGPLPENCVTLITGASGGVGVASTQLAHALGHTVIALSRSESKRQQLATLGANLTLDPADTQWRRKLKDFLLNRRVDLAIDNIGGPQFNALLDTLNMNGRISVVGRLAGPVPSFNTASLFFRRLRIGGVAIGTYTPDESHHAWKTTLKLLAQTNARPVVDSIHPFTQLPAAFARLEQGPMGKVLLAVAK